MPLIRPVTFPFLSCFQLCFLSETELKATSMNQLHHGLCGCTGPFSISPPIRHNSLFASLAPNGQETGTSVKLSTPNPFQEDNSLLLVGYSCVRFFGVFFPPGA